LNLLVYCTKFNEQDFFGESPEKVNDLFNGIEKVKQIELYKELDLLFNWISIINFMHIQFYRKYVIFIQINEWNFLQL